MDMTNDKGQRLYFPTAEDAAYALAEQGFEAPRQGDMGFWSKPDGRDWIEADIRYNSQGYFVRVFIN